MADWLWLPNPPKFSPVKVLCYKTFPMIIWEYNHNCLVVYVLKFYDRFDYGVSFITLCFVAMETTLWIYSCKLEWL